MRSTKQDNLGTEPAELTDAERQAASERFRVIWPFLECGVPLKRIALEQGKSLRTLRYWVALYRKGDIPALVPRRRSDRGKRRMREELKALAEALWLREPRRPVSSIHRQVAREARSRGALVPSYDQVLAVVRAAGPRSGPTIPSRRERSCTTITRSSKPGERRTLRRPLHPLSRATATSEPR